MWEAAGAGRRGHRIDQTKEAALGDVSGPATACSSGQLVEAMLADILTGARAVGGQLDGSATARTYPSDGSLH